MYKHIDQRNSIIKRLSSIVWRQELDLYNEFLDLPTQPTEACTYEDFKVELEMQGVMKGKMEYMSYSEVGSAQ